ncbi:MAG TPA: YwmB family TATA-box binding protein [Bacillaceae bacterium]
MGKRNHVFWAMFVCFFGFMAVLFGNTTNAARTEADLSKLARAVLLHNGTIIEWSLHTRETVYLSTQKEWLKKKEELEDQFPELNWTMSNETGTAALVGYADRGTFSETIKLISTDKIRQSPSYLFYEVKGKKWDSASSDMISAHMAPRIQELFDKDPAIFSCIKGEFNVELNEVMRLSLDPILHALQANESESIKERDFYSISAYSPQLSQTLSFTNKKMNMQIGLRDNGTGTTAFVIGTPILTIEY